MTIISSEILSTLSFTFIPPPSRGDPLPILIVLVPLAVLSLLLAPFFYFTKNQTIKKVGGSVYFWFGLVAFILGLGLLLFPIFFIGTLIYGFLTGSGKPLTLKGSIIGFAVWLAIPGIPLIFGSLLLHLSIVIAGKAKQS